MLAGTGTMLTTVTPLTPPALVPALAHGLTPLGDMDAVLTSCTLGTAPLPADPDVTVFTVNPFTFATVNVTVVLLVKLPCSVTTDGAKPPSIVGIIPAGGAGAPLPLPHATVSEAPLPLGDGDVATTQMPLGCTLFSCTHTSYVPPTPTTTLAVSIDSGAGTPPDAAFTNVPVLTTLAALGPTVPRHNVPCVTICTTSAVENNGDPDALEPNAFTLICHASPPLISVGLIVTDAPPWIISPYLPLAGNHTVLLLLPPLTSWPPTHKLYTPFATALLTLNVTTSGATQNPLPACTKLLTTLTPLTIADDVAPPH